MSSLHRVFGKRFLRSSLASVLRRGPRKLPVRSDSQFGKTPSPRMDEDSQFSCVMISSTFKNTFPAACPLRRSHAQSPHATSNPRIAHSKTRNRLPHRVASARPPRPRQSALAAPRTCCGRARVRGTRFRCLQGVDARYTIRNASSTGEAYSTNQL